MAHTTRKHKYNEHRTESKPARKETSRLVRRESKAASREALAYQGEVDVSFPKHQKTSGWLTH